MPRPDPNARRSSRPKPTDDGLNGDHGAGDPRTQREYIAAAVPARPIVQIADGDLPRMVDEAESALIAADLGIYQRGGWIVEPSRVVVPVTGGTKAEAVRLKPVTAPAIVEKMTIAADFQKY